MLKRQVITCAADLDLLESKIVASAESTATAIKLVLNNYKAIHALAILKFSESGRDPLDHKRPLNIIEQLNQSFTYLASIAAARWLLEHHPSCAPLILNLGTTSGPDIISQCGPARRTAARDCAGADRASPPYRCPVERGSERSSRKLSRRATANEQAEGSGFAAGQDCHETLAGFTL